MVSDNLEGCRGILPLITLHAPYQIYWSLNILIEIIRSSISHQIRALKKLFLIVDVHWAEVCNSLPLIGDYLKWAAFALHFSCSSRHLITRLASLKVHNFGWQCVYSLLHGWYILCDRLSLTYLLYVTNKATLSMRWWTSNNTDALNLNCLEELSEDPTFPAADLAAAVASKCFYHLQGIVAYPNTFHSMRLSDVGGELLTWSHCFCNKLLIPLIWNTPLFIKTARLSTMLHAVFIISLRCFFISILWLVSTIQCP